MDKRNPSSHEASFWGYARAFLHVHMARERLLSAETVEAYRISLECLIGYLENVRGRERPDITFDDLDRPVLKDWLKWMVEDRGYSPKTIELRLTSVRSFLRYAGSEDVSLMGLYDGARTLKGPKGPKKPIAHMSEAATEAVLGAFAGATSRERRDRAMLVLLYDTGARVSELADATVRDLVLAEPARITVTGKGRKARTVPLMDKTVGHMEAYLDEFHPGWRGARPGEPLFYCRRHGRPVQLSTDAISSVLKKAAEIARERCPEVPARVHPHLIRKTRAMDLYRQGIPLPIIAQLLGHESISTTSGFYAFAGEEMVFEAMSQIAQPALADSQAKWRDEKVLAALYSLR